MTSLVFRRNSGYYPGPLTNILQIDSLMYLYPIEDFADAQLVLKNEAIRKGEILEASPLYNCSFSDYHFSKAGAEVWAKAVARRLVLLMNREPPAVPES